MGMNKDLCIRALELNRDDADRAVEWLLSPHAEAYIHGGGMQKRAVGASPRWSAAMDLGLVVGMPPKLCYHALELRNDNSNDATSWLLEHGSAYASMPWIVDTTADVRISASSQAKV
jgi:hypothetical protein